MVRYMLDAFLYSAVVLRQLYLEHSVGLGAQLWWHHFPQEHDKRVATGIHSVYEWNDEDYEIRQELGATHNKQHYHRHKHALIL